MGGSPFIVFALHSMYALRDERVHTEETAWYTSPCESLDYAKVNQSIEGKIAEPYGVSY